MDVDAIRREFPALENRLHDRSIIFADNASTALKPRSVIDAVCHYYRFACGNVHRGVNAIAREAERLYEDARNKVARFINAEPGEIIFVRNATQGINLASHLAGLRPFDEVVATVAEHHSNILPWANKARIQLANVNEEGRVDVGSVEMLITVRTRLIAIGHVSNVTGLVNPIEEIIELAKAHHLLTLVDAAQSAPHITLDVKKLGCDFLVFSGHKMGGPSGVGVLYARREMIEEASPLEFGGGMVTHVDGSRFQMEGAPTRFEAGTPSIEGAIGLGAAIDFLRSVGMAEIHRHSLQLGRYLVEGLATVPRLLVYPRCLPEHLGIASFVLPGMSVDDVARALSDRFGIMTRSGLHCAEPLVRHFGQPGMVRVSLYIYNNLREIDDIISALNLLSREGSGE